MGKEKIRWGLLGAGVIIDRWIKGAMQVEDMEIAAVASRTAESARHMAEKYGIPEVMSYGELLGRDDIDAVYVPVPHTAHKDLTIRALEAGKNVLVEKPAAVTAADFEEMAACAKKNGKFLMEAVWTRFFPLAGKLEEVLKEGAIGDLRLMQSSFSFRSMPEAAPRLFDPARAGGALLDVGVYDLHFADMVFGRQPDAITGMASMDTDSLHLKVDEQNSFIARYDNGALAVMTSAVRTTMPDTAWLFGTEGSIEIPVFWKPQKMHLVTDTRDEWIEAPVSQKIEGIEDEGYQYEIRHVNDCIRSGLTQSPVMTWEKTGNVLTLCDQLRARWGLRYPFE